MINRAVVPVTDEQERTALAWLAVLHDQPDNGDQATFSRWLQADPAHAEAYARAQVIWELSEVAGSTLAHEEALTLQRLLALLRRLFVPRYFVELRWLLTHISLHLRQQLALLIG